MIALKPRPFLLAALALLVFAVPSPGVTVDARYTLISQGRDNRESDRRTVADQYVVLGMERLFLKTLSLQAYGRYGEPFDGGAYRGDLYYLFLQYRTFESKTVFKLGRFPLQTHRFLTLDGAEVTARPFRHVGFSARAGRPKYFELDADRFDRAFPDTGDYLFGASLFLHGMPGLKGRLSYHREGGHGTVYRELMGLAADRTFSFALLGRDVKADLGALADINIDRGVLDRLDARLFLAVGARLRFTLEASRYDVKEAYPEGRELIVTILSTGREDRTAYTLAYAISETLSAYQGAVFTRVETPAGPWQDGTIVKGGIHGDFMKRRALDFDAGAYRFAGFSERASGLTLALRWRPLDKWTLDAGLEAVFLDTRLRDDDTATTVTAEVAYRPVARLKTALFAEQSDNPEYKSDFRLGVRLDYDFSLDMGRSRKAMAGDGSDGRR